MLGPLLTAAVLSAPMIDPLTFMQQRFKEEVLEKLVAATPQATREMNAAVAMGQPQSSTTGVARRELQGDSMSYSDVTALCSSPDMFATLFGAAGEAIGQCMCSDDMNANSFNRLFNEGNWEVNDLCGADCLPMAELLLSGQFGRRRLEATNSDAPTPMAIDSLEGRLLQASPSPDFSPDFSPSPSPDGVDPVEMLYCACAVPAVARAFEGYSYTEFTNREINDICAADECAAALQTAPFDCDGADEPEFTYAVTMEVTASGTVDDYTPAVQAELVTSFAEMLAVPEEQIEIEVLSASVIIVVTVYAYDEDEAAATEAKIANDLSPAVVEANLADITLAGGESIAVDSVSEPEVMAIKSDKKKSNWDLDISRDALIAICAGGGSGLLIIVVLICCCCCKCIQCSCCCCAKKEDKPAAAATPVAIQMHATSAAADKVDPAAGEKI